MLLYLFYHPNIRQSTAAQRSKSLRQVRQRRRRHLFNRKPGKGRSVVILLRLIFTKNVWGYNHPKG